MNVTAGVLQKLLAALNECTEWVRATALFCECRAACCALDDARIALCLSRMLLSSVALLCNVLY
jgi:hypothetical protein